MEIKIEGKFTQGYYNDMEAGYPVFINNESISDLIKNKLIELGMSANFCDDWDNGPGLISENKLIGKDVQVTIRIKE